MSLTTFGNSFRQSKRRISVAEHLELMERASAPRDIDFDVVSKIPARSGGGAGPLSSAATSTTSASSNSSGGSGSSSSSTQKSYSAAGSGPARLRGGGGGSDFRSGQSQGGGGGSGGGMSSSWGGHYLSSASDGRTAAHIKLSQGGQGGGSGSTNSSAAGGGGTDGRLKRAVRHVMSQGGQGGSNSNSNSSTAGGTHERTKRAVRHGAGASHGGSAGAAGGGGSSASAPSFAGPGLGGGGRGMGVGGGRRGGMGGRGPPGGRGGFGGLDSTRKSMTHSMATRSIAASILDLAHDVGDDDSGDDDDDWGLKQFAKQKQKRRATHHAAGILAGRSSGGGRGGGGAGGGRGGGLGLYASGVSMASRNVVTSSGGSHSAPHSPKKGGDNNFGAVDSATQYIWDSDADINHPHRGSVDSAVMNDDECPDPDGEAAGPEAGAQGAASRLFGGVKMGALMDSSQGCGSVISLDPQDHLADPDEGGHHLGDVVDAMKQTGSKFREAAWSVADMVSKLKDPPKDDHPDVTTAPARRGLGASRAASRSLSLASSAEEDNIAPKRHHSFGPLEFHFPGPQHPCDEFLDDEDRALGVAGLYRRGKRRCGNWADAFGERCNIVGSGTGSKWVRRAPFIATMVALVMICGGLIAAFLVGPGDEAGDGAGGGALGVAGAAPPAPAPTNATGDGSGGELLVCPDEEYLCPDGNETVVHRSPDRGCQFSPCPGVDPAVTCPLESFLCGDGLTRVYPNPNDACCFDPCPPGYGPPEKEPGEGEEENAGGGKEGLPPSNHGVGGDRVPHDVETPHPSAGTDLDDASEGSDSERYNDIKSAIAASGISDPAALSVRTSPQHKALSWLASTDPARLDPDHPALLQRYALAVFYHSTRPGGNGEGGAGSAAWTNSAGWIGEGGICGWHGVSCPPRDSGSGGEAPTSYDDNMGISGLNLTSNGLSGPLPPELAALANLVVLDLSSNQLTGSIPEDAFASMHELRVLSLGENELEGAIPPSLENAGNLVALDLGSNGLTGSIPPSLGQLADLEELRLDLNNLEGPVPSELFRLDKLQILNLEHNTLTGSIPDAFDGMSALVEVRLSENDLVGPIPPSIASVGLTLKELYLDSNSLTGSIPPQLGLDLPGLETLFLHKNELGGSVPTELGSLTSLRELTLNENGITGTIPTELGRLTSLESLFLEMNKLTGRIPDGLGKLMELEMLRLYGNDLTGSVPADVCALTTKEGGHKLVWVAADCAGDAPEVQCDCCDECH